MLKSAAQIGAGDVDGARETLDEALALLSGSDPTERTRGLVAEYVTYLEAVAAAEPARADVVAELEAEIISRETAFNLDREVSGTAPPSGSASVEGLRYEDGRLRLRLEWADLPAGYGADRRSGSSGRSPTGHGSSRPKSPSSST